MIYTLWHRRFLVYIFLVSISSSCISKETAETAIAFSLSDKMMEQCEFRKVSREQVRNELRLFGKITADNNKMVNVFPVVSGVVTSVNVEIGDYVEQGQLLAQIRSGEVALFQREMLNAESDLAIAEKNLEVAKDLFAGRLNSEKDVIAAGREVEKARAELARIKEIYSIYSLQPGGAVFNITAPISGFIIHKKINKNEQLRADNTDPVFAIAEINEVWALANVNESDIAKIENGQEIAVHTLAFPDSVFRGKIDKIFNYIDPQTKSMKVRVKIKNADYRLKPDMNCTVSVYAKENREMIAVPSQAIIFDRNKHWVMVFHDKYKIESRKVHVYRQLGDITYIDEGLSEGETIITANSLLVYDAMND